MSLSLRRPLALDYLAATACCAGSSVAVPRMRLRRRFRSRLCPGWGAAPGRAERCALSYCVGVAAGGDAQLAAVLHWGKSPTNTLFSASARSLGRL